MTTFINPTNNYQVEVSTPGSFLGCLFFGFLYFLIKGEYKHALVSLILAVVTGGVSWLIYPFFAPYVIRNMYLEKGFKQA